MKASNFKTGLLNGTSIPLGTTAILTITGTKSVTFEDDENPTLIVMTDYQGGKGFPCNQDRLDVLLTALDDETDSWVGRQLRAWQGGAQYKGKKTPSLKIAVIPLKGERDPNMPPAPPPPTDSDFGDNMLPEGVVDDADEGRDYGRRYLP
jgi:hypothetical protein